MDTWQIYNKRPDQAKSLPGRERFCVPNQKTFGSPLKTALAYCLRAIALVRKKVSHEHMKEHVGEHGKCQRVERRICRVENELNHRSLNPQPQDQHKTNRWSLFRNDDTRDKCLTTLRSNMRSSGTVRPPTPCIKTEAVPSWSRLKFCFARWSKPVSKSWRRLRTK